MIKTQRKIRNLFVNDQKCIFKKKEATILSCDDDSWCNIIYSMFPIDNSTRLTIKLKKWREILMSLDETRIFV